MEIEIHEFVEVEIDKKVSIGPDYIMAALAQAHADAEQEETDERVLLRAISTAYEVLNAIPEVQIVRELKQSHQVLIAEKLRQLARRFELCCLESRPHEQSRLQSQIPNPKSEI